jgi:hypothetical protein
MTARSTIVAVLLALVSSVALLAPASVRSAPPDVTFAQPTASGAFGQSLTFRSDFRASSAPRRVELLTTLPGDSARRVVQASVEPVADGAWRATVREAGHVVPNTTYEYRFRVVTDDGAALGPVASHTVVDTRVEWQRLDGQGVSVWWDHGDRAFAERALAIAEEALASASELLGVADLAHVDFFVYSDDVVFRQALGPGTRENVGGEAHPNIHTLFGLIEPDQVGSDWVEELIVHELAHIVFDEASSNPYAYPPRWLNEGLAVFLAKGYDDGDRAQVEAAARSGSLIPLEGLVGQFPTRAFGFSLAYAESVSAVSHFVESFGQPALAALITSFPDGRTLDEAFIAATGQGFQAFEDDWLASLGATRREPAGPRPPELGVQPDAWASPGSGALLP